MNRRFRSPNAGQTSLTLQHDTSPRSGFKPALGANRDGYPMGGIPVQGFKSGGRVGLKHGKVPVWKFWGGAKKKIEERKYKTIEGMQGSGLKITDEQKKYLETHKVKPKKEPVKEAKGGRVALKEGSKKNWIQKAVNPKHKGFCTPMTKKTCTPRRKALAMTFKKMGRARKGKG